MMRADHRANATRVIAELSRASGLRFSRPDRLSRQEAEQVLNWGEKHPEVMQAYMDPKHAAHDEVMSLAAWGFYFSADHPQDDAGQPREWSDVRTVDDDAEAEPEWDDPFKDFSPQQARELIEAALKGDDPKFRQFREAYENPHHPDHKLANREFERLHQIEAGAAPAAVAAGDNAGGSAAPNGGGSAPGAPLDRATALKRIDAMYKDPELMKRYGSSDREVRDAATAEVAAVFAAAYPEPAPAAEGDGGAAE
jgi:hypothetical protein